MIKLYNTLTRKIETFKPRRAKQVGLYGCGPTVYNYVHLGNLRAYIFVDLLKRYLRYSGYNVKHVMNITDVEDKTIKGSQAENKSLKEFTDFYLQAFLQDLEVLNIEKPEVMPRATEHIKEMVALVKKLQANGYAYEANGSIYFRISGFKGYGKLSQLDKQSLKKNAEKRNIKDEYEREEANDFVLWKVYQPEDGEVCWDTEIGRGRPGWHIECSAMSMKYLGESFDIHTGGVDLIFPHHTNEIAQSEGASGQKFVNYWLHNDHLIVDGQKMSKSLHNFYTLRDVQDKGYNPLLARLILLKTHYRQKLNFTFIGFQEAEAIVAKFLDALINLDFVNNSQKNSLGIKELIKQTRSSFKDGLDDDLNISLGLAALFNFLNEVNKVLKSLNKAQAREIKEFLFEVDAVLGFIELFYKQYQDRLSELANNSEVKALLQERKQARQEKDYEKADRIRKELEQKGIIINDTKDSYNLRLTKIL